MRQPVIPSLLIVLGAPAPALQPAQARAPANLVAPGVCDPFALWREMGSPEALSEEQRLALLRASELPEARPVHVEGSAVSLTMPGFAVMQIELERRP